MTTWRYIKNDNVIASAGLAADVVLANCSGAGTSLPTLRLYTYQPCALVGRFQTIENELNLITALKTRYLLIVDPPVVEP